MSSTCDLLEELYKTLSDWWGPTGWWPGDTPFEIIVGAILTQNTAWVNVERAIDNLKGAGALSPEAMGALPPEVLAELVRPSGYYNQKARKLADFLAFVGETYGGSVEAMAEAPLPQLRAQLLAVRGIGPETADSILLYACGKAVFVTDAYTERILSRHGLVPAGAGYDEVQALFTDNLPADVDLYAEYHGLIVHLGKEHCRRRKPLCEGCPAQAALGPPVPGPGQA